MNANREKTIFLTGRKGFIGRNLHEYLSPKYTVLAPSHKELELLDQEEVKRYFQDNRIDIVIHSATTPSHRKIREPKETAYRNLRIFFNIVRNSPHFSKMIFVGSGAEYGIQKDIINVKETSFDSCVPEDEHGFSKYVCSKYIERADKIVNLRLFGIFGKYEDYQIRFISNVICKAIYNLPLTMKQNRVFSYLFMDDFLKIIDYFIGNAQQQKIYNVVPGEKIELIDIARTVNEISGKNLDINVRLPGMGREYTADNSLLVQEIKGLRFTPMREAITKFYNWYEENRHAIDEKLLLHDP
ncbi:MAG: NAD-dependent epimerase/dehydratase family protein [Candidatus Aureabacteria bacterium]|nr:NAD-dependent epimerase/dehydratase family protein [Candidatus Auribacterota bacterium]